MKARRLARARHRVASPQRETRQAASLQEVLSQIMAPLALCLLLCLFMGSCAQTGPPLPPSLELPKPPADLRAIRKGSRVTLSWSEPTLTTDRQTVRYLGPTLVCRSMETEMNACGIPEGMIPPPSSAPQKAAKPRRAAPASSAERPAPLTYSVTLPAAMQQQNPAAEVTYAVEVLNRNARAAGLSNRVHVPAIVTLAAPSDLSAALNGEGVILSWTSPGKAQNLPANPAVNQPSLQVFYRIYRRVENSGKDAIAGEIPLGEGGAIHFTDSGFEWEKTYLYRVTSVSILKRPGSEVQVEGDDTPPVRVFAHDVFPPSVPTGLQAADSGEGQKPFIDLIWAPVTNTDLAGYNIYRSEENGAAVKLNSEVVKSPSYRDSAVVSGKTYAYTVSAVDVRGNESRRSEEASEAVP